MITSPAFAQDIVIDSTIVDEEKYFKNLSEEDSFYITERHLPPGEINRIRQEKSFWYADSAFKDPELVNQKEYVPIGQRKWFQVLLWIFIVGGFAFALISYLSGNKIGLFRRRNMETASAGETGEIPEDIFLINYEREIEHAAADGNYRLAIRLMFLRVLKSMADKNIIQYKQDRTNFEYLLQLKPTEYYSPFFQLTRHYEYAWYGHFEVERPVYEVIRNNFNQLDRQIEIKQY